MRSISNAWQQLLINNNYCRWIYSATQYDFQRKISKIKNYDNLFWKINFLSHVISLVWPSLLQIFQDTFLHIFFANDFNFIFRYFFQKSIQISFFSFQANEKNIFLSRQNSLSLIFFSKFLSSEYAIFCRTKNAKITFSLKANY